MSAKKTKPKPKTHKQLMAIRNKSKVVRRRFLVHEYEYKLCPQCKGTGKQLHSTLYHPADGVQDYETTCQFCHGEGESGYINVMVECQKKEDGTYAPYGDRGA